MDEISNISLSKELYFDLFEHICFELIENNEMDCAKEILTNSIPLILLKKKDKNRWDRLNYLIYSTNFNSKYYKYDTKEKSRFNLINNIKKEIIEIEPSRLLKLISKSIKYEQLKGNLKKGMTYDLLSNNDINNENLNTKENEKIIKKNTCIIEFGNNIPLCSKFSPDGQLLVSGSSDGFIEIWDFDTGKLRIDLESQSNKQLMVHTQFNPITALAFSNDGINIYI